MDQLRNGGFRQARAMVVARSNQVWIYFKGKIKTNLLTDWIWDMKGMN